MKDFKPTWRESSIYFLKMRYGKQYNAWKDQGHHDDRQVYCNIYRRQFEALQSLPADPLNYICVAMNHHMQEDRATLDAIREVFKDR